MKGQGTIIVMFSIITLTMFAGVLALQSTSSLPRVLQNNVNDLQVVSDAETRTDFVVYDYIPMAAAYSTDQASVELEKKDYHKNQAGEVKENITARLNGSAESYLESSYLGKPGSLTCQVSIPDVALSVEDTGENASVTVSSGSPLASTTCTRSGTEVRYVTPRRETTGTVYGNRILNIAENTENVFRAMKQEAERQVNPGTTDGDATCGYSSASAAEQAALDDARRKAVNRLDAIENNVVNAGRDVPNLDEMTRTIQVIASRSIRHKSPLSSDADECSPGTRSTFYRGDASYSYFYEKLVISDFYEDDRYTIPVESGWKHLNLTSVYVHEFTR
ncbi:MAG: hypothetical protein ABEJ64_01440 [Candidatus Nanohaloarchaea archaeon]